VSLIHQELNLAENLTSRTICSSVASTRRGFLRVLNRSAMAERAKELLARCGVAGIARERRVENLPAGREANSVEIARRSARRFASSS